MSHYRRDTCAGARQILSNLFRAVRRPTVSGRSAAVHSNRHGGASSTDTLVCRCRRATDLCAAAILNSPLLLLDKAGIPRQQFSRSILVTCREEIGRVGRAGLGLDEVLATCAQQVVRVGFAEFGERHDTRRNGQHCTLQQTGVDQSGKRVAS